MIRFLMTSSGDACFAAHEGDAFDAAAAPLFGSTSGVCAFDHDFHREYVCSHDRRSSARSSIGTLVVFACTSRDSVRDMNELGSVGGRRCESDECEGNSLI